MKKTDGFTLIELLVGILCAALITGAAMSTLLMGARVNQSLNDSNSNQQTTRIITSLIESLASEGSIKTVVTVGDVISGEEGKNDWALLDEDGNTILNYSFSDATIYSQGTVPLMENVISAYIALSDSDTITGRLLNFTLETEEGVYKSSVFCRTANITNKTIDSDQFPDIEVDDDDISISISASEQTGRFALLEVLCSQYGSKGEIKAPFTGTYFSEWYLNKAYGYDSYDEYNAVYHLTGDSAWDANTPWCACFLSWGLEQVREYLGPNILHFADVDDGKKFLLYENYEGTYGMWYDRADHTPAAGDFIFFSWDNDYSKLEHVGAVFYADSQYVYTVEGNNSDRVELNRYALDDSSIVGYGVLDWK